MPGLKAAIVPVTPFQQNCSILWDEETLRAAVVDPGGDVGQILAAVEKLGVRPEKILLTHGHIDHAGGAADLKEALQARAGGAAVPIEGPDERDRFLLQGLAEQGEELAALDPHGDVVECGDRARPFAEPFGDTQRLDGSRALPFRHRAAIPQRYASPT